MHLIPVRRLYCSRRISPQLSDIFQVYDVPVNITIPSTAVSNGKGSFSYQLPFPENKQFLISMSDAYGFGSGGVSAVLTVGPSQGRTCNTTRAGKSPRHYDMIAFCDLARCRLYLSIEYPLTTVQVCQVLISTFLHVELSICQALSLYPTIRKGCNQSLSM